MDDPPAGTGDPRSVPGRAPRSGRPGRLVTRGGGATPDLTATEPPAVHDDAVDRWVVRWMNDHGVPGLSLAVVDGDRSTIRWRSIWMGCRNTGARSRSGGC